MKIDIDRITGIIKEVAESEIMPRFNKLSADDVTSKTSQTDLVTVADYEAEKQLSKQLLSITPDAKIIGEEEAYKNPDVFKYLDTDNPVWIIDPVDGTRNFVNGSRHFAVILSLVISGQTKAGWIYSPCDEKIAIAELGKGCFINGKKVTVPPSKPIKKMIGGASHRKENLKNYVSNIKWLGSAAHCYLELLESRFDFAIFRNPLRPWDHGAGVLMYTEAGGYVRLFSREKYTPYPTKDFMLLAPDKETWEDIFSRI